MPDTKNSQLRRSKQIKSTKFKFLLLPREGGSSQSCQSCRGILAKGFATGACYLQLPLLHICTSLSGNMYLWQEPEWVVQRGHLSMWQERVLSTSSATFGPWRLLGFSATPKNGAGPARTPPKCLPHCHIRLATRPAPAPATVPAPLAWHIV